MSDLFKMQSDSSAPKSEREPHDCATKFERLNAATRRQTGLPLHLLQSGLGYGDTTTIPGAVLIFKRRFILMLLHSLPHLNKHCMATLSQSLMLKSV